MIKETIKWNILLQENYVTYVYALSNQIKIFKFDPDTNEIKLIKEFYASEY